MDITQEQLKSVVEYDPLTGNFVRITGQGPSKSGAIAGTVKSGAYVRVSLFGKSYKAHRLAFLYMKGVFPAHEVDHVNRIRSDNRWANLREATPSENAQNKASLGVSFNKYHGKYHARIKVCGISRHLGYANTFGEASSMYAEAKKRLHPFLV